MLEGFFISGIEALLPGFAWWKGFCFWTGL
jgi:hypothetical protein